MSQVRSVDSAPSTLRLVDRLCLIHGSEVLDPLVLGHDLVNINAISDTEQNYGPRGATPSNEDGRLSRRLYDEKEVKSGGWHESHHGKRGDD